MHLLLVSGQHGRFRAAGRRGSLASPDHASTPADRVLAPTCWSAARRLSADHAASARLRARRI